MEDNKKETNLLKEEVKEYYTKSEVDKLISDKLNDNLKDLLVRFNNIIPKEQEKPKQEEIKKELSEKELMF